MEILKKEITHVIRIAYVRNKFCFFHRVINILLTMQTFLLTSHQFSQVPVDNNVDNYIKAIAMLFTKELKNY